MIGPASLIRSLDAAAARAVKERAGWRCESCGRDCGPGREYQAHWAHHVSRRYRATRWALGNACCLCAPCHARYTEHPREHWEFVGRLIGEAALAALLIESRRIVRWRESELRALLASLSDGR